MTAARWMELTRKWNLRPLASFGVSAGMFLILKLLTFIPLLGWSLKAVFVLCALGALLTTKAAKWKKVR